MHIQRLLVLTILALSLSAAADFRTTTEVWEVELIYLRLPASEGGTLAFSDCADCKVLTLRATAATRYVVNHQDVTLADFRQAIRRITNRKDVIIDVSHHLETNTVTKVRVKL
jgi:biopolymer transport protein ExbD